MCLSMSRKASTPSTPAPTPEQDAPAYTTHETYDGPGHPKRQRGNKDYRVGETASAPTTENPDRS